MQLWQMDIAGSVFLTGGIECKLISGIDDHSRFCVIATVVRRGTARAVCRAFLAAMRICGIPDEVLTDNGKQFTGRFSKPRPTEVLFEQICPGGMTRAVTHTRQRIPSSLCTRHPCSAGAAHRHGYPRWSSRLRQHAG